MCAFVEKSSAPIHAGRHGPVIYYCLLDALTFLDVCAVQGLPLYVMWNEIMIIIICLWYAVVISVSEINPFLRIRTRYLGIIRLIDSPVVCQKGRCNAVITTQMDDQTVCPRFQRFVEVTAWERILLPCVPGIVRLVVRLALPVKAVKFVQVVFRQVRLASHAGNRPVVGHRQVAFHGAIRAVNPACTPGLTTNGGGIVCGAVTIVIPQIKGRVIR